ncbi:MAG: hypothetical protein H7246_15310 [Phycisphaerae bacterium]|nr:hypothetical protein [Saprospiraceae bacterium]
MLRLRVQAGWAYVFKIADFRHQYLTDSLVSGSFHSSTLRHQARPHAHAWRLSLHSVPRR